MEEDSEDKQENGFLGVCTVALVCVLVSAGCSVNTGKKEDTTKSGGTQMVNTVTQESQTIGLTGVSNARQLGGYITTDGKKIKDGVLLRTGQLDSQIKI